MKCTNLPVLVDTQIISYVAGQLMMSIVAKAVVIETPDIDLASLKSFMKILMEEDGQWKSWLADDVPPDLLSTPLPDEIAKEVVRRLKEEADRHWFIDPNYSLKYANRIVSIGHARNDNSYVALGLMAQ